RGFPYPGIFSRAPRSPGRLAGVYPGRGLAPHPGRAQGEFPAAPLPHHLLLRPRALSHLPFPPTRLLLDKGGPEGPALPLPELPAHLLPPDLRHDLLPETSAAASTHGGRARRRLGQPPDGPIPPLRSYHCRPPAGPHRPPGDAASHPRR